MAPKLTFAEKTRAIKCLKNFELGADSFQKTELPSCFVSNCKSTIKHGGLVTDTLATWIKKDFVAGPFDSPPFDNFRVNCLMAVDQKDKVRPVINMSLPAGNSFNENVKKHLLEKVHMATAKQFGFRLFDCGLNAWMSKVDINDAYKTIRAKNSDLRLQGFTWLGKFFVDKSQIFGANTAVANFDISGNTYRSMALAMSSIPKQLVLRCLDDFAAVCPSDQQWCSEFSHNLKTVCREIGIKLADDCPKAEKAFTSKRKGKVLGIWFDSTEMTWSYPQDKTARLISEIKKCYSSSSLTEHDYQVLSGRLNDFGQMVPFLQAFKRPYLDCARSVAPALSIEAKKDLLVWAACAADSTKGLPVPKEPQPPPPFCKVFVSDAAGVPNVNNFVKDAGVGGLAFNEDGDIILTFQFIWPKEFFIFHDKKGAIMGNKTTSLELLGILIPFLLCPEQMINQRIVFKVDNLACIFSWSKKYCKNDAVASIILRAIFLVSNYLGSVIYIEHLPRVSTWEGTVVDRLSRLSSTSYSDRRLLRDHGRPSLPSCLASWVESPSEDWELPIRCLSYVKTLV